MAARLTMLLPRLAALVVIWLLAAASFTFAAGGEEPVPSAGEAAAGPERPEALIVPDVRRQAYVFAKGILQDAGFAWRVEGPVDGYSANTVAVQTPAPGAKVVDNGAPTIVLRLERNGDYPERGLPENRSRGGGTPVVLLRDWLRAHPSVPAAETEAMETAPAETAPAPTTTEAPPATTEAPPATTAAEPPPAPDDEQAYRRPAFEVEGAPREPADEMPLPERARMLERRLLGAGKPGRSLVRFWLYQHSWIVTGARFGWKDGDDALRILVRLDERLERRYGFGGKSAVTARRALADVRRLG